MNKTLKKILKVILIALLVIVLIAVGYVGYVLISYSRIDDNVTLDVKTGENSLNVQTGTTYTVVTQNLGFGAYTPEFTFFMDGGKESWARSKEGVIECITEGANKAKEFTPDFIFFQEVDTDSTRSYHVDQREILCDNFGGYSSAFAVNYHSAFLPYPILKPHGASNSGIITFSKFDITSSLRRSLPISESLSKFLDLDRCYSVSRVPVEGGKELVLYNVHLSAYGGSAEIADSQMQMLFDDMEAEYLKGNYCVCGGDFNHDFTGSSEPDLNGGEDTGMGWTEPFPNKLLPSVISRAINYDGGELLPTCRNCDIPYVEGNWTVIVDGFLISENVTVESVVNVQTGFSYSDHSPVVMKFKLN